MPLLLEAALLSRAFQLSPAELGLDVRDPRLLRTLEVALRVHDVAHDRKAAPKKGEWDKAHPQGRRLLEWARRGAADPSRVTGSHTVVLEVPGRPRPVR